MGHYSDDAHSVRVDFFKPSGKWYTTEAVRWLDYEEKDIFKAFRDSLLAAGIHLRLVGMTAVCLEPHHKHGYPLMLVVPDAEAVPLGSFERDD